MNETNEQQSLDLLSSEQLGEALEAVLFASGYPLSFEKLAQTFQKTEGNVAVLPRSMPRHTIKAPGHPVSDSG